MPLGDKIRALKKPEKPNPRYAAWNDALDRAAALADEQQTDTDALVAAAYEDAALMAGPDPRNEIATAIRARVPADARAALDRLIREAEARGMKMGAADTENWFGEVFSKEAAKHLCDLAAKHREGGNG